MTGLRAFFVLFLAAASLPATASDEPLRIAVASNFRLAADDLIEAFGVQNSANLTVSAASTGKLYAQIVNGAPFHVLLAADAERPERLEEAGLAVAGSRFTYALGRLVLWSRNGVAGHSDCLAALATLAESGDSTSGRIALANPAIAPYGLATRQTLESLSLWESLQGRLVFGENVSQALQFAVSGNARFGFVAAAQLRHAAVPPSDCRWAVPAGLHEPIRQQAVLLTRASRNLTATSFMHFLQSDVARDIIRRHDYRLEPIQ